MLTATVGFRISDEQYQQVLKIAEEHMVAPSVVMRWAITNYLKDYNDKPAVKV